MLGTIIGIIAGGIGIYDKVNNIFKSDKVSQLKEVSFLAFSKTLKKIAESYKNVPIGELANEFNRFDVKIHNIEEKIFEGLYEATGGIPLAVKWAVGQTKLEGESIDRVLQRLHSAEEDIFELVFSESWLNGTPP